MRGILCGRLDCLRLPRIALWSRGVLQFNLTVGGGLRLCVHFTRHGKTN